MTKYKKAKEKIKKNERQKIEKKIRGKTKNSAVQRRLRRGKITIVEDTTEQSILRERDGRKQIHKTGPPIGSSVGRMFCNHPLLIVCHSLTACGRRNSTASSQPASRSIRIILLSCTSTVIPTKSCGKQRHQHHHADLITLRGTYHLQHLCRLLNLPTALTTFALRATIDSPNSANTRLRTCLLASLILSTTLLCILFLGRELKHFPSQLLFL